MKGQNQVRKSLYSILLQDHTCENSLFNVHCYCCFAVVKYGIDRNDIVLGRILGEGFFGEVYDGVYKKAVSLKGLSAVCYRASIKYMIALEINGSTQSECAVTCV